MNTSRRRLIPGAVIAAILVSAPVVWWAVRANQEQDQGFVLVKEGVLYRSRQPDPLDRRKLAQDGITQVVNLCLRDEDQRVYDAEDAVCRQAGVKLFHMPINTPVPTDQEIETFLRLVLGNQGATLVHCSKGKSRTGAMVACFRVVVEGWEPDRAMDDFLEHYFKGPPDSHPADKHYDLNKPLLDRLFKDRQAWLERIHNPATQP
jgi:protein tyrosine/serine phosphatase